MYGWFFDDSVRQSDKHHLSRVKIWDGDLVILSSDCRRVFWHDFQKGKNIFHCSHKLIITLWNWYLTFFSLYILAEELLSMIVLRFSLPATHGSLHQSQSPKWRPHGWPCRKRKNSKEIHMLHKSLFSSWWLRKIGTSSFSCNFKCQGI